MSITILSIIAPDISHAGRSYLRTLNKWTKTGRVFAFETLDAILIWKATYLSIELLDAQRQLIHEKKMDQDIPIEIPEGVGFFVTVFVKKELREFSMDKNSVWKIVLIGENGEEIQPFKVDPIPRTPTYWILYPHLDGWQKAYYVEFPKIGLGKEPKLILRSIVAQSELKWNLK
ncbi:MAG: hypothetical protein COV46_00100 [Deltaproteobacteria bacterium CG11_big_fil_rev_8_21_14_0_20_49_13]|nr:MAG: hypothetical protein COV46_00100 [Deltaproteobacteria bacterium CG11_big_fil_rev_8_21_14_0_20_49_13]